jgi:hypothetical protein
MQILQQAGIERLRLLVLLRWRLPQGNCVIE